MKKQFTEQQIIFQSDKIWSFWRGWERLPAPGYIGSPGSISFAYSAAANLSVIPAI